MFTSFKIDINHFVLVSPADSEVFKRTICAICVNFDCLEQALVAPEPNLKDFETAARVMLIVEWWLVDFKAKLLLGPKEFTTSSVGKGHETFSVPALTAPGPSGKSF